MTDPQVPCLILLKSPHPREQAIYVLLINSFAKSQVDKERAEPGSSIMKYTYNEKVIVVNQYFNENVCGFSYGGRTDNNDGLQFEAFMTVAEADAILDAQPELERYHPDSYCTRDYGHYMHLLFPTCYDIEKG